LHRALLAVAVLVPVAGVVAAGMVRAAATPPGSWARSERRLALAGALLTIPAAVALGAVDGIAEGVGALLLWGALAAVFAGAARLDGEDPDGDTRWLIDISCLAFVGVTVFFSVVDFGYVFLPASALLLVAWRLAHLRRRRRARRPRGTPASQPLP